MLGAWHHFQEWILTRLIPVLQLLRLSGRPKFCHGKPLSSHTMLWCCIRHLVVSNIYTPKTLPSFDTEEEGMGIWGVCWEFFWHFVGNAFRFHDVPCVISGGSSGSFTSALKSLWSANFRQWSALRCSTRFMRLVYTNGGGAHGPSNSSVQLGNATQRLGPHVTWAPKR